MIKILVRTAVVAVLCGLFSLNAFADGSAQAIIDESIGEGSQGVLGVNMASGDSNLQTNASAVTMNAANGPASAHTQIEQTINGGDFSVPDIAVARVNGSAFSHANGAIGINQAAGAANAQVNCVAIALGAGAEVAADTVLSQSVAGIPPETMAAHGQQRETSVAGTAFSGTHGIVQVNQSAGIGNATSNSFALRVHLGASQ